MNVTRVFENLLDTMTNPLIRGVASKGGTRSSKTWSMLQLLYIVAMTCKRPLLISCVAATLPAVKRGMLRDFKSMLLAEGAWDDGQFNKTEGIYYLRNGSVIEFFGCDNAAKVHGAARDILFVNEAQNISKEIFRQMDVRTRWKVFIDFNPVRKFWGDTDFVGARYATIHSTYKDNTYLTADQIGAIEKNKRDANWWRVYGEGLTGGLEGLVYPDFDEVDEYPTDLIAFECLGLDFGFVNDPTAIVRVGFRGWDLYIDLLTYRTGMLNGHIAEAVLATGLSRKYCVCDSAEQKSIAELARMRIRAVGCVKGRGSIEAGIAQVKQFNLHITKRSVKLIDELSNYTWVKDDNNDTYTNKPIDAWNHALDATRYAVEFLIRNYKRRG